MKDLLFAGLAAALGLSASWAAAGNESRYRAFDMGNGTFEVVADFTENAIYWCGASLFARQALGGAQGQRIYVLQAPSPSRAVPGEKAVTFGLEPPPSGAVASYTNGTIVGNSLTVSQAFGGCSERSASG